MTAVSVARLRLMALATVVVLAALVPSVLVGDELALVRSAVTGAGIWSGVVFVAIHVAVCFAPVPRSGLAVVAGALFGAADGIALSVVASSLAALFTFALARRFGREAIAQLRGPRIDRVEKTLRDRGLLALIAARITPIAPFFLTNYGAGLSSVRNRDYVLSLVALIPGSVVWAMVGSTMAGGASG